MIPEGWQEKEIGEVATLQRGFDLPEQNRIFGIYPIISSSGVTGFHNTFKVSPPGVVTGRYGTIGEVFFVDTDFWPLNTSLWVKDFHGNSHRYVYYLLKSIDYKKLSDKTGVPGINRNDVHKIRVVLPPLPEQRKIAEILSSWDKAIALLEQLITAKRKLKQGLMQQLLTGKKRFNEFEGSEWAEHQLSEVATITMGTSTNSEAYNIRLWERSFGKPPSDWDYQLLNSFLSERTERQINDGTYPLFSLTIEEGITPKTDRYNREFLLNNAESNEYKVVYPGDIVYNPMNLRFGALAISNLKFAVIVSAYYNVLQIDKLKSNGNFLAYLLLSERLMSVYERVASGSLLEKKRVHFSEFRNIILPLPPLPEQQKIASILSTADTEISNLEKQLAAYKKQKRGLMQQLLTGKKRVKLNESQMQKV